MRGQADHFRQGSKSLDVRGVLQGVLHLQWRGLSGLMYPSRAVVRPELLTSYAVKHYVPSLTFYVHV